MEKRPSARWAAFDHIADIDFFSLEVNAGQQLFQELASCADKGAPLAIFVEAGGLADEHESSVLGAFAGHGMSASLGQDTILANGDFFAEFG